MRSALVVLALLLTTPLFANFREFTQIPVDPALEAQLQRIADEIFAANPKLTRGNLSITLIDVTIAPRRASFDGSVPYHPASVVKAFYLVYTHHLLETGKRRMSPELERAMHDMIVDSSNDATHYVVDFITDTASGPELPPRAFAKFVKKRGAVNDYFRAMGYDTNTIGKAFCEDAYGRDRQLLGEKRERRNRITSDAAASLVYWIVQRGAVSAARSEQMLTLMQRTVSPVAGVRPEDTNVADFTGELLPPGAKLWTKPGWTSEVRHDATYVELPNGKKYVLAVLTRGDGANMRLLPEIGAKVLATMQ